jgi:hypothetical protein
MLNGVVTLTDFRKKGMATLLLDILKATAKEMNCFAISAKPSQKWHDIFLKMGACPPRAASFMTDEKRAEFKATREQLGRRKTGGVELVIQAAEVDLQLGVCILKHRPYPFAILILT